jgi:hypothetical protein
MYCEMVVMQISMCKGLQGPLSFKKAQTRTNDGFAGSSSEMPKPC